MVGFVIHHEDVLLAADLASQNAIEQRRVAFDVARRLDFNFLEIAFLVSLFLEHGQHPSRDLVLIIFQLR